MHTGTRPFKRIQLTLTALLRGCGFHAVWVGGNALHRPGWENYNKKTKEKKKKTVRWQEMCTHNVCEHKVPMCAFVRGEMV